MKILNIPAGARFGWLTIVKVSLDRAKNSRIQYICQCDCGNLLTVTSSNLRRGNSKSCGCKKINLIRNFNLKHGNAQVGHVSKEYKAYQKAKDRCSNPNNIRYKDYGERGIKFRFNSFEDFLAEVGPRPSKHYSLNRIKNDGHYVTGNVEWANKTTQSRNRRNNILLTFSGSTKVLSEWTETLNLNYNKTYRRLKRDWCVDCVLNDLSSCKHKKQT